MMWSNSAGLKQPWAISHRLRRKLNRIEHHKPKTNRQSSIVNDMTDRFIDKQKTAWQRLEELLDLLDRSSLRRLHREEVRELGRIYRRTASDLAIARAESRDPRLVNYLNSLVIRAHGRIYRATIPNACRILVEDAAHVIHLDQPVLFNAIAVGFLTAPVPQPVASGVA